MGVEIISDACCCSSEGIETPCCEGIFISTTLTASIVSDCVDIGTRDVEITYIADEFDPRWEGTFLSGCDDVVTVKFWCDGAQFLVELRADTGFVKFVISAPGNLTCDPFEVLLDLSEEEDADICGCSAWGSTTITITP